MAIDLGLIPLNTFAATTIAFIPTLIATTILLLVGWVLGKIIGKITKQILNKVNADKYLRVGKAFKVSEFFSLIVSWIIYLAFIQSAVETLGIDAMTVFVGELLSFIPKLLEGMIILIVGYVLAGYVQKQIVSTKAEYSSLMGRVIFFFTMIIAVALALPFVGINPVLINNIILVMIASIGIGTSIALGFGLRDVVADMAKKYLKKQ